MSCGFDPTSYIMGKLSGSGGGGVEVESLSVTQNGTYTAPTGKAYSPVNVNVGGGGGTSVEKKAVNFYDYEGTRLYSYTKEEFQNLTEMPENPSHEGLVAQGWNYTLEQAKAQATIGACDIGQMYTTSDGKTRLYIHVEPIPALVYVRFTQTVSRGVTVDWGDGSTPETFTGTSATNYSHRYLVGGNYIITFEVTAGTISFIGSSSAGIYGSTTSNRNNVRIWKAEIGDKVTIIGDYAFNTCYNLVSITISNSVTSISSSAFDNCSNLASITIPNSVTSIGGVTFNRCYNLASIIIPNSVTAISSNAFYYCSGLATITITNSVTSIGSNAFSGCYNLASITIPNSVTSIDSYAFNNCYRVFEYHLLPTTPPTLSNTNAFSGIQNGTIIYVPYSEDHSILEAYKSATNWATYARYMQEEPQ